MVAYHDDEWGVPTHDDAALFELLTLEGAQAGLSWRTILGKRAGYRSAFAGFDPARGRRATPPTTSSGSWPTRRSCATGGRSSRRSRTPGGSSRSRPSRAASTPSCGAFVGGRPIVGEWRALGDLPAATDESKALSKDLKRRGFRFVGPTTMYAFMQAAGLVDDHVVELLPAHARRMTS